MNKFYLKIILPSIISILLFILTIFLVIIPNFQTNIMNGKREMIKELTNSAWSILSKYENDERNGLLSTEEAQKTAASRIQYLRYGEENKDYFWITDLYPNMVMHPYRTDLNGKDLTNISDPHGKKLFVEFVNTVKKTEHGYVDYMWQWKDDSTHIVPKLSYVKIFKPWGWVIGTGIYIEDVKKEITALTRKLLWISISISILIGLLLLFISQQSLKIEKERIEAEKELLESKEKYRTLVEAATEGLLMLVDGKISFANNVIKQMTGFDSTDILNLSFDEVLSDNNNPVILNSFKNKKVPEGQFEINIKKKNGGFIEVLITASSALFYGKSVIIIIVKDITIDRNNTLLNIDYQKLLSSINIGLFRAKIDSKGKFISANDTAIKILGFNNFNELSDIYILELFASIDDKKNLRSDLIANGYIKNKLIKIRKRSNETSIVSVTLIVSNNDNTTDLVCDGTIEDITTSEELKELNSSLISELKFSNFILEQPVNNFITPIDYISSEPTINQVVKYLAAKKTDCVLLSNSNNDFIGIITNSDIQKRVLSLNLSLDNSAYLIMTSPIISLNENSNIAQALKLSEENNINHIAIRNDLNMLIGILNISEINNSLKNSLSYSIKNINYAETIQELKLYYNKLKLIIKPLANSDIIAKHLTHITSSFSDAIIKRTIELSINQIGNPPVNFAFVCLGSEGRKEESLYTDQDNAIIYENVAADNNESIQNYFLKLGELVCNALDTIGYSFCRGNIMAKNPQWCKSLYVWDNYFRSWIATPEPQNLLDATIFFDLL